MNKEIIAIVLNIKDGAIREQIESFVNNDVSRYCQDLDRFSAEIKNDGNELQLEKSILLKKIVDGIVCKGEAAMVGVDKKVALEIRKGFRALRPQFYYASDIVRKGYQKPRGYPGDFEMMNYVYNCRTCSDSLMGKYWDYYFVHDAYAVGVRGRKDKMVEMLRKVMDEFKGKNLRVLNLPCGPARDVQEFVQSKYLRKDIKMEIVCVDQDLEALEYARNTVGRLPDNVEVVFKQGDILQYLRRPEKHGKELGMFDFVYSIGIADYLSDKLLKNMILFSWNILKKTGQTTFAFKIHERDPAAPLPPKWYCDWQFVPRSLDKSCSVMISFGGEEFELAPVDWEKSGRVAFLTLRKN